MNQSSQMYSPLPLKVYGTCSDTRGSCDKVDCTKLSFIDYSDIDNLLYKENEECISGLSVQLQAVILVISVV